MICILILAIAFVYNFIFILMPSAFSADAVKAFSNAALLTALGVFILEILLIYIARPKLIAKCGGNSSKGYIPVYGEAILWDKVGCSSAFKRVYIIAVANSIWYYVVSFVNNGLPLGAVQSGTILGYASIAILYIIALIGYFGFCKNLADAFGKGIGYAFGLFFFGPVLRFALAFGSARFYGISGSGDAQMDALRQNS